MAVPQPAPLDDALPEAPPAPSQGIVARLQDFRARHERAEMLSFLLLGFAVDVLTLGRIDNSMLLVQQAAYLVLLGGLLALEQRASFSGWAPSGLLAKPWAWREGAIHFLLGSLLSAFAIFYFKSASALTSLVFLGLVAALLVGNELPVVRRLGPVVRVALFGFCLTSFLAYVLPMLFGFMSAWLFVLAALLSLGVTWLFHRLARRWTDAPRASWLQVVLPGAAVQALLLTLYFSGAVPPVPLSMKEIGVYHQVTREGGDYVLRVEHPERSFFDFGDPPLVMRPGDRVYCFVRIFAPTDFRDRVRLRWSFEDPERGWEQTDTIPMSVSGGRNDGYRGFAWKKNHRPGQWRVEVLSDDDRTIGSIDFELVAAAGVQDETSRAFVEERG